MEVQAIRSRGALVRRRHLGMVWRVLTVLVVLYAVHQLFGLGGRGSNDLFNEWVNDGVLWAATVACLGGALTASRSRAAWLLVSLALASWALGDTIWSVRFADATSPPLTSISDVFWLAWYPLVIAALALLVRDRVPGFELDRWIDGVAVMLVLATPWVALFLQPVAEHSHVSSLAAVVDFAYPLGDVMLVGATLGVFALMGWRPSRMWLALGIGLAVMGVADAIYSVQSLGPSHTTDFYDAAWTAGAVLVAYAACQPQPGRLKPREISGWPAIALPLAAQALAVGIQIYGFFHEIPRSERILTLLVLMIAVVQIVMRRPRPRSTAVQPSDSSEAAPPLG